MLDLVIDNQQTTVTIPDDELLQKWAVAALITEQATQVSLLIVDEESGQQLNNEYRGKDYATNVLSFPMDMPEAMQATVEINLLGDLVICAAVVKKEAEQQQKQFDAHWAHMLIHGMLHLQGFDHENELDAEKMESTEVSLLKKLGFTNPYQSDKN